MTVAPALGTLIVALLTAAGGVQATVVSRPQLTLRAQALATSHELRLGDLVTVDALPPEQAKQLANVRLGIAPALGQVLEIERGTVQRLAAAAGVGVALDGAPIVKVRREAQQVEAATLCDAALTGLRRHAASQLVGLDFSAECVNGLGATEVGSGQLTVQARTSEADILDGRRQVAVELGVGGRVERTVRVPVDVSLQAMQWCAKESIAAGESMLASHFSACRRPVRSATQARQAGQPLPAGRLRRALRAGDLLAMADVADVETQMRGDAVSVMYRAGTLAVESRGELSQDARVGDVVRVHLRTGEWVTGRLAAARQVEIEEQR